MPTITSSSTEPTGSTAQQIAKITSCLIEVLEIIDVRYKYNSTLAEAIYDIDDNLPIDLRTRIVFDLINVTLSKGVLTSLSKKTPLVQKHKFLECKNSILEEAVKAAKDYEDFSAKIKKLQSMSNSCHVSNELKLLKLKESLEEMFFDFSLGLSLEKDIKSNYSQNDKFLETSFYETITSILKPYVSKTMQDTHEALFDSNNKKLYEILSGEYLERKLSKHPITELLNDSSFVTNVVNAFSEQNREKFKKHKKHYSKMREEEGRTPPQLKICETEAEATKNNNERGKHIYNTVLLCEAVAFLSEYFNQAKFNAWKITEKRQKEHLAHFCIEENDYRQKIVKQEDDELQKLNSILLDSVQYAEWNHNAKLFELSYQLEQTIITKSAIRGTIKSECNTVYEHIKHCLSYLMSLELLENKFNKRAATCLFSIGSQNQTPAKDNEQKVHNNKHYTIEASNMVKQQIDTLKSNNKELLEEVLSGQARCLKYSSLCDLVEKLGGSIECKKGSHRIVTINGEKSIVVQPHGSSSNELFRAHIKFFKKAFESAGITLAALEAIDRWNHREQSCKYSLSLQSYR